MVVLVVVYMIQTKLNLQKKINTKLISVFDYINYYLYGFIISCFRCINFLRNRSKILIFTDSRGFEVTKFYNRRNPFSSYIGRLVTRFNCTVKICPEKFTSLLDFMAYYHSLKNSSFDCIILHCGIVDFAPRPESSFDQMLSDKKKFFEMYPIYEIIKKEIRNSKVKYQGENTYSFLNEEALNNVVLPILKNIPNIIYIGASPVLLNWDGSYWRKRPENINDVLILDAIMKRALINHISLSCLTTEQIKKYTSDNVHYTKDGFEYIYKQLESRLPAI